MTVTPQDVKLIVSLERQIENHGIKRLSVTTKDSKTLIFDEGTGWNTEKNPNLEVCLPKGEKMSTRKALDEITAAKRILDKHWDAGMLLEFSYHQYEGFQYGYSDGLYEDTA